MLTSEQQAITRILTQATQYRASDVHLVPGNPPVLRIDGKLTPLNDSVILTAELLRAYVETTLTPVQLERLDKDRDARIVVSLEGKMRFRLIVMYQKGTISLELRYIPDVVPTLKELSLPAVVEKFPAISQGLIIISGPFGSGRTTTLAALVSAINSLRACHIVTLERPIEFLFAGEKSVIEQREVGIDVTSVSHGLEVLGLEDVDVVVISELEDQMDMQAVVRATRAGRLVLATLAADSAVQSIELLTTAFSEQEQPWARKKLSEVLQGVLNLRLVPRVGGGRILVSEVLAPSTAMRAVIRDGQFLQLANTMQTSREEGSVSLDRSLAELVRIGDIMSEDAEQAAFDPTNLKFMVSRG